MTKNSETQNVCKKCNGKRWYKYDDCHSKFCEYCCKHDQGYWLLPEGYTSAGNYCCNAGCGHTITPKEFKKVSNSTQNDWEDEIKDMLSDAGLKPIHFMLNNSGVRILNRIREELADARREAIAELDEKIEKLAELEHEQWRSWMKYISEHFQTLSINTFIATRTANYLCDYKDLSEIEKEKDRIWARKVLATLREEEKHG